MITLNNINLSSIDLSGIDLRGIKLGLGGRGGGSGDGFPVLPGDVTRWHFGGLTNEMMSAMDDPRIEDADHKGRFLSFKNFAWSGMSGVGGYVENYNRWTKSAVRADITFTDHSFNVTSVKINQAQFYYQSSGGEQPFTVPSGTVIVKGLTDGQVLEYIYTDIEGRHVFTVKNDGIYTLPSFEFIAKGAYYGFQFNKVQESCNITIEQLPLYPGAIVFDGVDDCGTCDNFPILTKEKGYTVVALRQWISMGEGISGLVSNVKNWFNDGAFVLEYNSNNATNKFVNRPVSFGNVNIEMDLPNNFTYQTSKSYKGVPITTGSFKGTNSLFVGKLNNIIGNCSNVAIWELVFLDHDATEEELTKIKDYFVKTYPWLFPDQAWTVTGKTNEDEDRATIANITGNGNNLVLSNFGFAEGSGYGLYETNFMNWIDSRRATFTRTSSKINVTAVLKEVNATFTYSTESRLKQRIKVTGLPEGVSLILGRTNFVFYTIAQDGIYDIDVTDDSGSSSPIIGYRINKILDSCDITIEQIPEYEGYLVTDGVDDKVQSSSFTMNEDWTIVGDWELLSNVQINCGIVKAQNVYLYNIANGLLISINNPRSLQSFGTKSLHAICSDGRLYDRNWVEYEYTVDQNFKIVESSLNIGFNLNNYTQIAFKNLGIYNNQILSKEDCIKAYNYLQTLKAK